MKTNKRKPAKKPARKQPATKPAKAAINPNKLVVGDRAYCVYNSVRFPIPGTVAALFSCGDIHRAVVQHDENVTHTFGWRPDPFKQDTSVFKVWGAQYVFPIPE